MADWQQQDEGDTAEAGEGKGEGMPEEDVTHADA